MIDWLACLLVKFIGGLLCRLPPSVAVWCGERLGELAYALQPKRVRVGLLNLRAAFDPSTRAPTLAGGASSFDSAQDSLGVVPPRTECRARHEASERSESRDDGQLTLPQAHQTLRRCFRQLGAGIVELLRLPVIDRAYIDRYVTLEPYPRYQAVVASGRPVVFLTAHYGNWELSSIFSALKGYPIVALARSQARFPRLYKLLVSYRESKGCTIAHKGGALRGLLRALAQRQAVGIVADQASRQGVFVPFFGRPALFATGPLELAYTHEAIVVPAFIHRLHGPFHRIILEPPIEFPQGVSKREAVRSALEQFVAALARHIQEDPGQWLWMHKRWKHTPARRLLVLSDGKRGHLKQSVAVAQMMRERHPAATSEVVEVRYRHRPARALALVWSWWVPGRFGAAWCLRRTLSPESASALLSRYADVLISCGASLAPVNRLWASENGAKSVVIMNPTPLPLSRFSLVLAPQHDRLPIRANVVQTAGAISWIREEELHQAGHTLQGHPKFHPTHRAVPHQQTLAVFLGGDTIDCELSVTFVERLIAEVLSACEALDGRCLVTTSRRTAPPVERWLTDRLGTHPRCPFLLIASRDALDGTMEGMLGLADVAVVTGESVSMVSEACAAAPRVIVVEPPRRHHARTKHQRFLQALVRQGAIHLVAATAVGQAIQEALGERAPVVNRPDHLATVRDALARLL